MVISKISEDRSFHWYLTYQIMTNPDKGLMDVTKLFEIGHFPYKIVEFQSMKQVCKPKKKQFSCWR